MKINVVDLFSGPGGLGEGFSSLKTNGQPVFDIRMSVEMDRDAHTTLTHRAFFRRLKRGARARFLEYCKDPRGKGAQILDDLKARYSDEWRQACAETLYRPTAMGNSKVWTKIEKGDRITKKDWEDTEDQQKISRRIAEVRNESDKMDAFTVVIGGPPCQAYSGPGRNRSRSIEGYKPDEDQRFFLYREYCRVLAELAPDIFIMENVPGITSAALANKKKIFPEVLRALENPAKELGLSKHRKNVSYRLYSLGDRSYYKEGEQIPDFTLKSSDYGVPQSRKRVIVVGISSRLEVDMGSLGELKKRPEMTIQEVIGDMPRVRSGISRRISEAKDTDENWHNDLELLCNELIHDLRLELDRIPDLLNNLREARRCLHALNKPRFSTVALGDLVKRVRIQKKKALGRSMNSFEDLYGKKGSHTKESSNKWARLARDVDAEIDKSIRARETNQKLLPRIIDHLSSLTPARTDLSRGSAYFLPSNGYDPRIKFKFVRRNLKGVLNHYAKEHQRFDRKVYLFCCTWAYANRDVKQPSPRSIEFPDCLVPDHQNWDEGGYADRFRCIEASKVSPTITSHLAKDGHAFIHYDPLQNRCLTPRECARIQTFPDDYFFEGEHSSQYRQVGNAVPPFLAKQIAKWVYELLATTERR